MRKLLFILVGLVLSLPVFAQNPVQWSSEVSELDSNGAYRLKYKAVISEGYHIYGVAQRQDGPFATTITLSTEGECELIGGLTLDGASNAEPDPVNAELVDSAVFYQDVKLTGAYATVAAEIEWMACTDEFCSMPQQITLSNSIGCPKSYVQQSGAFHQGSESIWGLILAAILWGLAAILTPCVFPMVPLTVSFFLRNSKGTKSKLRALLYGAFIVLLYTVPISIVILVTRLAGGDAVTADIFNFLSTHWIPNLLFFVVFMLFAASLLGAFEIQLPSRLVNGSDKRSSAGGVGGVFFLALTLVLVSFSCTGPIVGTVLIQSTSGLFWAPIVTIFVFSLVFALPFVLLALFPGLLDKLPKSGNWLNSIKVTLGFVEIALGLKFFSVADQVYHWGLLDRGLYLIIWIVCAVALGLYYLGLINFKFDKRGRESSIAGATLGAVCFLFAAYLSTGLWERPLKALSGYLPPLETQRLSFIRHDSSRNASTLTMPLGLDGYFNLDEAIEASKVHGKPLFVSITGHGCVNCREMESRVWSKPEVYFLLSNKFVICLLYTDDKLEMPSEDWVTDGSGRVLKTMGRINSHIAQNRFGAASQPFYIVLDHDGKEVIEPKGYDLDSENFALWLQKAIDAVDKKD